MHGIKIRTFKNTADSYRQETCCIYCKTDPDTAEHLIIFEKTKKRLQY